MNKSHRHTNNWKRLTSPKSVVGWTKVSHVVYSLVGREWLFTLICSSYIVLGHTFGLFLLATKKYLPVEDYDVI